MVTGQKLAEIADNNRGDSLVGKFEKTNSAALLSREFDRSALAAKGLKYERLDQLTIDILLGEAS